MRFRATVELNGKTATGIEVPDEVLASLGDSARPAVVVTINGYSYRTTIGRMGGRSLISVSAEVRGASGVAAGDSVDVDVVLDGAPRGVDVPADLAAALDAEPEARRTFDGSAPSHKKEWVRWVEEAKKAETRTTRIAKAVEALRAGKRSR